MITATTSGLAVNGRQDHSAPLSADRAAIDRYLAELFGTADDGFLAIWDVETSGTAWVPVDDLDRSAQTIERLSTAGRNVYVGMGLHPVNRGPKERGKAEGVTGLPGLFADVDFRTDEPAHKSTALPTEAQALGLIAAMPLSPTMIVHSGHGFYPFWLFHEVETTDGDTDEQQAAKRALLAYTNRGWQALLKRYAKDRTYDLDPTADLARVLRPAGVVNRKAGCAPFLVRIVHEGGPRYALGDFEHYLPDEVTELRETTHIDKTESERANLDKVLSGCEWLRQSYETAATLTEPEWFAGMSIVANCNGGEQLAHDYSSPYPGYTVDETTRKAAAARAADKPVRCATVAADYSGESFCGRCPNRGRINSPIVLGTLVDVTFTARDGTGSGSRQEAINTQESVDWSELQPLPPPTPTPTLPPELIPEAFRPWLSDIAELSRTPIEMIAAPALVALGAVIGRSVGVRPWSFNDFVTVPNIWGAVVARPGWMKSSAVSEGLKPVLRLAATATDDYEARKDAAGAKIAALEAVQKELKKRMETAAKNDAPLGDLEAQFAAKEREIREAKVTERRYLTHDATTAKLGELLRENPRGMLVVRDELYGLLSSFSKSGNEGDRQFYLEAWDGTGSFTSDRIGRGTIHIPALTLSLVGSIQPGRLRGLIEDASAGGGGDDGLLQRFQMLVWPDQLAEWRHPDRWPDSAARDRAFSIFQKLDSATAEHLRAKCDRDGAIPYLTFSPAAQDIARIWRDELEHRLRSGVLEDSPSFASHIAKYRSLMPSLALLFHLIDVADGQVNPGPIVEHSARLAADWCDYLELHARKLYDVELDRGKAAARLLAAKIKDGAIVNGQAVRVIYRNQWSGLRTDEIVIDGLRVLADLGWVRLAAVPSDGGRPTQVVYLHPELQKGGLS